MDVIALFITDPQSPLAEERGEDPLDDAAVFSQSASMGGVSFCNPRNDPLGSRGFRFLFSTSLARSAYSSPGLLRLPPPGCLIEGVAFTRGIASWQSWTFAPVWITANGIPLPSLMICLFEPFFPRSVGLGPVFALQKEPAPNCCLPRPWTSRSGRPNPTRPARHARLSARHQKPANRVVAASRSCRSRILFQGAATPCQCLYGQRTGARQGKNRSDTRGRPPLGRGFSGGRRGSILSHKPSGSIELAISGSP